MMVICLNIPNVQFHPYLLKTLTCRCLVLQLCTKSNIERTGESLSKTGYNLWNLLYSLHSTYDGNLFEYTKLSI